MRKGFLHTAISAALLGAALLTSCAPVNEVVIGDKKYKETKYTQVREESVTKYTLRNGACVITKEVPNGIVSFQVWFRTGSRDEDDSNTGISHFIEHLIFKGSAKTGVMGLSRIIESRGGDLNGATSKDYTNYHFETAKEHFYASLDGMMDCIKNPLFDAEELEKERKVVLEEIARGDDDPGRTLYENIFKAGYGSHPYAREVIGTKEVISKLTQKDVLEYYRKSYSPERMIIVAVGDFRSAELLDALKKYMPASEKAVSPSNEGGKAVFSPARKELKGNYGQAYFGAAWLGPEAKDPDTYAMDLLITVLGSGRSSRLYSKLKEKEQLCYSLDTGYSTMKEEGPVTVYAELSPDKLKSFEERLLEEIRSVVSGGVSEAEFFKALAILENAYIFSHETNSQVAGSLGYYEAVSSYRQELDYMENIRKVKREDLARVAAKYLSAAPAVVTLVPEGK